MNPYRSLPDHAFWRRAVAGPDEVDPVASVPFTIAAADKVATAGSCFAQHIARHLSKAGFSYYVTERAHPLVAAEDAAEFNYGTYTSRYGNLYTARQLLQLFDRAYGHFRPLEDVWGGEGGLIDPFRPQIQPGGFATRTEYDLDRRAHFASVRRAFESLDVLVFTLGLTESWLSREDGAVFPVCPGVSGGDFDPARHVFHNFTVDEVVADLTAFIARLRTVNPTARMILTVSPVPLVATAGDDHVLSATTYSKAVLRVAAETVSRSHRDVAYFPSYEIITGPAARGRYYAEDLRSVLEEGVSHVMRVFMRHYAKDHEAAAAPVPAPPDRVDTIGRMRELVKVACEEEALDS